MIEAGRSRISNTAVPAQDPALSLPLLPHDSEARAELLAQIAAVIVAAYGPVVALAAAAAIDEAAQDAGAG